MKKSNGDDERRRRTAVTRRRRRQRRQQKFASTQRKSNNERQTINNIVTSLDDLGFQTAWFIQWLFHHSTHSTNRYVYHYSTKPLTTPVPRHHSTTQPLTTEHSTIHHSPLTTVFLSRCSSFVRSAATLQRRTEPTFAVALDVRSLVSGFWSYSRRTPPPHRSTTTPRDNTTTHHNTRYTTVNTPRRVDQHHATTFVTRQRCHDVVATTNAKCIAPQLTLQCMREPTEQRRNGARRTD